MKLLFFLISHLKSETDSTDTVSHLSHTSFPPIIYYTFRLGLCRRLVSPSYRILQGCLRVHHTTIPTSTGSWWQMASGKPIQQWSQRNSSWISSWQTHEVIGSPPNVSVPTHFAKVVLASKPSSPSTPDILELSTGAFVLPNAVIRDDTPLESFIVPGRCLFEAKKRNWSIVVSGCRWAGCWALFVFGSCKSRLKTYLPDDKM